MSIDTQYVGGKIQLTFTFDAKEGGNDMEFARRVRSTVQWAVRELSPSANADLLHPDAANERALMRHAMKALNNAFNSVLLCGDAHIDATAAVRLANGQEESNG